MRSTDLSWEEQTYADAGRLWTGGMATAVVAAGVALIGVMVLHKLLHAPILSPGGLRQAADYAMIAFPVAAAVITLLATGVLHLLMSTTPQASQFFSWIAGLLLALVILQVFLHEADMLTKVETAAFYLLMGVAMITSLIGVSRSAVRYHRHQSYRESGDAGRYGYSDDPAYRNEPPGYRNGPPYRHDPAYRDPAYRNDPAYRDPAYRDPAYRNDPWR